MKIYKPVKGPQKEILKYMPRYEFKFFSQRKKRSAKGFQGKKSLNSYPALPTEMGGKPFIDSFLRYLAKKQSCPEKNDWYYI